MSTTIKIKAQNQEALDQKTTLILNLAQVFCTRGHLPNDYERNPDLGIVHIRESNEKFSLYPKGNDYWAFIKDAGDFYIVLEFRYRYDKVGEPVMTALVNAISMAFRNESVEILTT